jgi:membrane protein DedA with SNARE-associated domain
MVPIFRSLISVPAGVERMPVSTFLALTALGSLVWNLLFVLAGYGLGENWHIVEGYVSTYSKGVLAVAALAVLAIAAVRLAGGRRTVERSDRM